MRRKFSSNLVSIIASIFTILTILGSIILLIFSFLGDVHIIVAIISILATAFLVSLIYALSNALERIEQLEKVLIDKKIIDILDLEKEEKTIEEIENAEVEGVSLCPNCGYQIFEDDKECPNCHKKIEK